MVDPDLIGHCTNNRCGKSPGCHRNEQGWYSVHLIRNTMAGKALPQSQGSVGGIWGGSQGGNCARAQAHGDFHPRARADLVDLADLPGI